LYDDIEVLDLILGVLKFLPKFSLFVVVTLLVFIFLVDEILLFGGQISDLLFSNENFLVDVFKILNLPLDQVLQLEPFLKRVLIGSC